MYKKIMLVFMITVISFNTTFISANAATNLSHSEMSDIYGSGYTNALLETVVEVNAKASTRLEENRNLLTQYYDGTKDYIHQRIQDYGNVNNFADLLIEQASGAMTLSQSVLDLLSSLFKSEDGGSNDNTPSSCNRIYQEYSVEKGWGVVIYKDCPAYIYQVLWTGNSQRVGKGLYAAYKREDRTEYNIGGYTSTLPPPPTTLAGMNAVLNSISSDLYIGDEDGNRIYSVAPVVDPNKTHYNTVFKNYRDYPSSRQPVYIPQLQPKLSCPDGDKIVQIDGRGGFVHPNGVPVNSDGCTVYWQKPSVSVDDDGKVKLTDPVTGETTDVDIKPPIKNPVEDKGEGCDSVLCFLGGVTSGIADLIGTILGLVGDLLDGLFDLVKKIFVPSDGFWSSNLDVMKDKFFHEELKEVQNGVESLETVGGGQFGDVNVSLLGVDDIKLIDSSPINMTLDTIHSWVRGFFYPLLLFFNINQMYRVIRGTSLIGIGGKKEE